MMSELTKIKKIGPSTLKLLNEADIFTIEQLASTPIYELVKIKGVGKKSATKWVEEAMRLSRKTDLRTDILDRPQKASIDKIKSISPNTINQLHNDMRKVLSRLEKIENRLAQLETDSKRRKASDISYSEKRNLENEKMLKDIIIERISEISSNKLGIKKITLHELFESINQDYSVIISDFSNILLKLHNKHKIQLEPGLIDDGFSIRDNYGNIYKVIRLLD